MGQGGGVGLLQPVKFYLPGTSMCSVTWKLYTLSFGILMEVSLCRYD
jgi:hypothetical protein